MICLSPALQEDVPAGEDGSGGSEDSGSDDDGSDEDSDESSEDEEEDEDEEEEDEEAEKEDEPLTLEWPDTRRKQATYLFLLPIIIPLWLTVPDVRNQVEIHTHFWGQLRCLKFLIVVFCFDITDFALQKSRKFFVGTFLGSILWIAVFSYLMVWWAHQVSYCASIQRWNLNCVALFPDCAHESRYQVLFNSL